MKKRPKNKKCLIEKKLNPGVFDSNFLVFPK
jgi:hypothetical protein